MGPVFVEHFVKIFFLKILICLWENLTNSSNHALYTSAVGLSYIALQLTIITKICKGEIEHFDIKMHGVVLGCSHEMPTPKRLFSATGSKQSLPHKQ